MIIGKTIRDLVLLLLKVNQIKYSFIFQILKKGRRPKVGDAVNFDLTQDNQQRIKAKHISIKGLSRENSSLNQNNVEPVKKNFFDYIAIAIQFWKFCDGLPEDVKSRADSAYELWQINPHAHGLYFKRVGKKQPIYSVRIGSSYRALGILQEDAVIWFWIGAHDEYERILKHL